MTEKQKTRSIFILTLVLAGGVYAWFYPLNKGIIRVTVNLPNFILEADGKSVNCPGSPCDIKVKSGAHRLNISKTGYVGIGRNVFVRRSQTSEESVELLKQVELKVSTFLPAGPTPPRAAPEGTEPATWQAHSWSKDGKTLVYLNRETGRLMHWTQDAITPITSLKTANELVFYLSSDANRLLIQEGAALYFVDIPAATRQKKQLSWEPTAITWNPDNQSILLNDETNQLFMAPWETREIKDVERILPLTNAVWATQSALVYYQTDENQNSEIVLYEASSDFGRVLIQRSGFPISRIALEPESRKVLLLNSQEKAWYELEY